MPGRYATLLFFCVTLTARGFGGSVAGQEQSRSGALLQSILSAWAKERTRVQSVKYAAEGDAVVPKDAYATDGHALAEDYHHQLTGEWLIDFSRNTYRIRWATHTLNLTRKTFLPEDDDYYFDGSHLVCTAIAPKSSGPTIAGR
jgi:hypothetical protein